MSTGYTSGKTIRLSLLGEAEYVSLAAFIDAANDIKDILRELAPAVSPDEGRDLEWAIVRATVGSMTMEVACVNNPVVGMLTTDKFVAGMEIIDRSVERPPFFNDRALEKARHLSGIISRTDVVRITLGTGDDDVDVTQHIAANVDALIGIRYEELGSVEGWIQALNIHNQYQFGIYDFLNERKVECAFPEQMLDDVVAAINRRAVVYGLIRTNARGEPISIRVESIQLLRSDSELPSIADLQGIDPDFTGGIDAAEYVRLMRDA